jgi:type IV pilus assembly protein PilC
MLFSSQLPLGSLIELCRTLRHYLSAGLTLRDVFRQQAKKGSPELRPVAQRISQGLEQGEDLEAMLRQEQAAFPPLFVAISQVGEQSGNLPEIYGELEKYYILQRKLQRQFWSQSAWPLFQFFAAIFVIAGLLWILEVVGGKDINGKPMDPLGFGLVGARGAVTFIISTFGTLGLCFVLYLLAVRTLRQKQLVDALLLRIPVLGPCLHALAMTRFCLALQLLLDSSIPITQALSMALRATSNAAFVGRTGDVVRSLKAGDDLTVALVQSRVFSEEFLHIVAVGEESGQLPEVMRHQARHYQEETERRLTFLTQAASWGVWLAVAMLIIFLIFRIVTTAILPAYGL